MAKCERAERAQQIKLHPSSGSGIRLSGWFDGRNTYLWIGEPGANGRWLGDIDGAKLYRFAKAVVRHYEADGDR